MTGQPYMDIKQYAAWLGVPFTWVRDAVTDGRLQCTRVGRHVRFSETDRAENEVAWRSPAVSVRRRHKVHRRAARVVHIRPEKRRSA